MTDPTSRTFTVTIDLQVYRLAAIKKAGYRVADRCTVVLGVIDGNTVPVSFHIRPGVSESASKEIVRLFFEELLDQELREQVGAETDAVRALILAHAFSKCDLIRRE